MIKILANDGIDASGKEKLEAAGITVDSNNIPQDQLPSKLNEYNGILVRSATKVRKDLIDTTPGLKFIGRGGVGMDNIDVEYARSKGVTVENTPAASSLSVAELVFAHLFTGVRFLYDANRNMPVKGSEDFGGLKKKYAKGIELRGKTIGLIGFGRIAQETAKIAFGLGMHVIAYNRNPKDVSLELEIAGQKIKVPFKTTSLEEVLKKSDFISLHVPQEKGQPPLLGTKEFDLMKKGVFVINCGRGESIDEVALLSALNSGKVAFAGLDVFHNEPKPNVEILKHPNISSTPHIGGSTVEAQERIGIEIADKIIEFFNK